MDNNQNNQDNYYYTEPVTEEKKDEDYAYQSVVNDGKPKSLAFSVVSLITGILSIICCCFTYFSIVLSICAIVFSVISRKKLGYFDGMSIAGLILGIFGAVFGIASIVISIAFKEVFEEMIKNMTETLPEGSEMPNINNGI